MNHDEEHGHKVTLFLSYATNTGCHNYITQITCDFFFLPQENHSDYTNHSDTKTSNTGTIYSVLTRSPSELLDEIILVDDGSTDLRLLNELPLYIDRHLPRTRLVRTHARTGLIRARVRGVSEASSPTVTFLDSHVEVSEGWLTPLMERLSDMTLPRLIVCPVITVINQNTLKPQASLDHGNTAYGVFDWKMIFHWKYHRKDPAPFIRGHKAISPSDPLESPTMAGGLFSMRVKDFYELGTYHL